jgi:hypothetical protein
MTAGVVVVVTFDLRCMTQTKKKRNEKRLRTKFGAGGMHSLTLVQICAGHVGQPWCPLAPLSSSKLWLGPQEKPEGLLTKAQLMGPHLGHPWRGCSVPRKLSWAPPRKVRHWGR